MSLPFSGTADISGNSTGPRGRVGPPPLRRREATYGPQIEWLMAAADDEVAMLLWAGDPGLAGLLRALFMALQPEEDERPRYPDRVPWHPPARHV